MFVCVCARASYSLGLSLFLKSRVEICREKFPSHFTKKKFNEHTSQKRKIEQSNKAAAAVATTKANFTTTMMMTIATKASSSCSSSSSSSSFALQNLLFRFRSRSRGSRPHSFQRQSSISVTSSSVSSSRKRNEGDDDERKEESKRFQSKLYAPKATTLTPIRSAYVHLPFCKQKCHYCDFATQIVGGNHQKSEKILDAMDAYTDFVCREITHQGRLRGTYDRTASRAKANGEKLETIFFGGGTPSLMSAKQMERLLASLENAFGIDWSQAEISMECDPGTFTRETLRSFVGLGVNRISLGAQSFDERVLKACGRTHGVLEIYESIEHVHALLGSGRRSISSGSSSSSSSSNSKFSGGGGGKSNAIETWSIDLISGLPGSTLETWEKGLYEAIECEAPHVSAYDLQVEEKTAFGKWYGNDDDDGDDEADDALLLTDAFKNRDKRTEEMKRADAKAKTFEERMEEIRRETDDEYSLKQRKKLEKEKQNKKVAYKLGDRLPLPSETVVAEQYKLASEILTARGGFHRYEISSFAKGAENECKHNKNYWDAINGSWYAFGLSATSRIDNERLARPRGMKQYYGFVQDFEQNAFGSEEAYSQLRKDCTDEEVLDEIVDAILERIMLGFRTARGVDVQELERSFGAKVVQELFDALRFVQETTNDESNDADDERKLYEITRDEKTNKIKAVRLTDPDGFLISTEIISTVISRMPSLKDA